ncbi:MAG: hypothetical protein HY000_30630 [Planctomycetes bacterium]|nr:hypothetical protein [Planctomycetota bacterium]
MSQTTKDPTPDSSPRARRIAWTSYLVVGVFLAVLICRVFYPWLRPCCQPQRGGPDLPFRAGDLTPLFSVWTQVTTRSLFERGEFPLWSDHIYCGEPFFAKPQVGVISLTTLLCALLPPQVVATWTFLLHLWIAGMAAYAWNLDVLRGDQADGAVAAETSRVPPELTHCLAAAAGAVSFMLSGLMAEQTMLGHGPIVLVACWTPLVLRSLSRSLTGDRPVRAACVAGVLVAVQLLAGGETMFLYNVIAGGIVGLVWLVCGAWNDELRQTARPRVQLAIVSAAARLLGVGGIVGLAGLGLAAIKLLPGLELMPLTNRAGGLALEDAAAPIVEFTEPAWLGAFTFGPRALVDVRHLFACASVLALVGLVAAWRRREHRWLAVVGGLLVLAGAAVAHSQAVFGLLWAVFPMFNYQRIPQRALVLAYLGISLLVALGTRHLLQTRRLRSGVGRWSAGLLLLGVVTAEALVALPALPPTADIRREIRANELLNHVAAEPGLFRIHAWESRDRNWGIEHVTVPLGLSNLAGWDHLWLREYLGAEGTIGRDVLPFLPASYLARHRERFWGMMNVRFVSAMHPLDRPGLKLVRQFPPCRECQPAKSAGPYLYENTEWLPRVWVAPRCVSVSGEPVVTYQLLDHPRFNPRRIVALGDEQHGLAQDRAHDAIMIPSAWEEMAAHRDKARARGQWILTYSRQSPELWQQPDELAEMLEDLMSRDPEPEPPVIETYGPHFIRMRLSGQVGFLVLAEKFAHFPGWAVRTASGPRFLLRANGVASAITLDGTEQWVELSYRPASLTTGATITFLSIALALLLAWRADRMMERFSTRWVQP